MVNTAKNYFAGPGYLYGTATEIGTNEGGNKSTVRVSATFGAQSGFASWSCGWVKYNINGQTKTLYTSPNSAPYDFYYYDSGAYGEDSAGYWDFEIAHNADGSAIDIAFSVEASTGMGQPSASSTITLTDYLRLPTAPATVTAVKSGSNVVVTSSDGSTYEGLPLNGYYVSYASSSNGGSTWSSWSAESTMTSQSYTYVNPTPGLTYKYRVRVNNSEGYSGYRESSTLFLTAGGKRYTGSQFVLTSTAAKRFDGSSFNSFTIAKRFDGSNWVNLS